MIVQVSNEDIMRTACKHIVFSLNKECGMDVGFTGYLAVKYFPEFLKEKDIALGTVITKQKFQKNFHALVCYSVRDNDGWKDSPEIITDCLNKIESREEETIACIYIGASPFSGADPIKNLQAIHASNKKIILHTFDYTEKAIFDELK